MPINYNEPLLDILREVAGNIFSEAPEFFAGDVVSTKNDLIAVGNHSFLAFEDGIKHLVTDLFESEQYKKYSGVRFNVGDINIIGIASRNSGETIFDKRSNVFILLHELAHITDKYFINQHQRELYADTLAYLLLIKETADENLASTKKLPFDKASKILDREEDDIGRYYSTNALLAVNNLANQIDIRKFNIFELGEIAKNITSEFSIPSETRADLFNKLSSDFKTTFKDSPYWERLLSSMLQTKDADSYRVCRQMSLSEEFQNFSAIRDAEPILKKLDNKMNFILDPVEEKRMLNKPSATLDIIKRLAV